MFCVGPHPQGALAEGVSTTLSQETLQQTFHCNRIKNLAQLSRLHKKLNKERSGCLLGPYPLAGYYRPGLIYWTDKALKYVRGALVSNLAQQEEQLERSEKVTGKGKVTGQLDAHQAPLRSEQEAKPAHKFSANSSWAAGT